MRERAEGAGCAAQIVTLITIVACVVVALLAFGVLRFRRFQSGDIHLEAAASPSTAKVGDVITYTMTVYNVDVREGLKIITVTDSLLGDLSGAFVSNLADGTSDQEVFTRTVQLADPHPLTNTVTVYAEGAGIVYSDTAVVTVDLLRPVVRVDASVTPPTAIRGETVTYTVAVANAGDLPVEVITLTDSLLGDLSASLVPTLTVGTSETRDFDWTVPLGDADPLERTVTVYAAGAGQIISDAAVAHVDLSRPAIQVEAAVSPTVVSRGEAATVTVTVSNPSPIDLEAIRVNDSQLGDLSRSFPLALAAGAAERRSFAWRVPVDAAGSLSRTVTVYATAAGEEVTDTDSTALAVSGLEVVVAGPSQARAGQPVSFTVTLTNTGSAGAPELILDSVTDFQGELTDDLPEACRALASGETCNFSYTAAAPSGANALTNAIELRYRPKGFANAVVGSADRTVEIFEASAAVELNGPALSPVGRRVDHAVTVVNESSPGAPDLIFESAIDLRGRELGLPDACDRLAPGEGCTFGYEAIVGSGEDPFTATVEVTYRPEGFADLVRASARHTVEIFQPSIAVEKTGPAEAIEGEDVIYAVSVSNTSSDDAPDLVLDSVIDSLKGDLTGGGRDIATTCPEQLASGDRCQITYTYTPSAADPGRLYSTVEVESHPLGFPDVVAAAGEHVLTVIPPWERGIGMPAETEVRTVVVCPGDPDVLYAGFGSRGYGVYRSGDAGRSWAPTALADAQVFGIAVDPAECGTVYAGAWRDNVRKSEDGGRSWVASGEGLDGAFVYSVVVDPSGDLVYAGTALRGLYRSEDAGRSWRAWGLESLTVPDLSVGPDGRVVIAATWGEGVFRRERSEAGWGDWAAINTGIPAVHHDTYAVAMDPEDGRTIFVATAAGGVYRSVDGGGTWEQVLSSPRTAYAVLVEAGDSGVVYAGTAEGVYRSAAGGEPGSWEAYSAGVEGLAVRSLTVGADDGDYVHLGSADGAWRRPR